MRLGRARQKLYRFLEAAAMAYARRTGGRFCPCCQRIVAKFRDFSPTYRNSICPICSSHPRHRLIMSYLRRISARLRDASILHIAPEEIIATFLRMHSSRYVSADLGSYVQVRIHEQARGRFLSKKVDVKMNIVDMPFADDRFDVVICSHVLEHIEDDRRALAEIHRVMRSRGWAILQTPMDCWRETSLEDPTINTPELRRKYYWQADHVRLYGRDILQRFSSAGFLPELVPPSLICDELELMGLELWEDLMLVRKL